MRKDIITERLVLRPSDDQRDLENYINHLKDEDIFFFQYGEQYSPELEELIDFHSSGVIYYSVFLRNSDTMIGYVGILPYQAEEYTGELEFYFFSEYRKKGYAMEAVKAYIQAYINGEFTGEKRNHIIAEVIAENEPAKAFLGELGFIKSAIGFAGNITDGDFQGYMKIVYEYKERMHVVTSGLRDVDNMVWFNDVDCIFGCDVDGDVVLIDSLEAYITEEICLEGKFDEIEEYELLDGGYQLIFKFRDETGEICLKINVPEEDKNPFLEDLKESIFYKIKGTIDYDKDGKTICISEVSGIKPIKEQRKNG